MAMTEECGRLMSEAMRLLNLSKCENISWLMAQELDAVIDGLGNMLETIESIKKGVEIYGREYSKLRVYDESGEVVKSLKHPEYWLDLISFLRQKIEKIKLDLEMEKLTIEEKRERILGELRNEPRQDTEGKEGSD